MYLQVGNKALQTTSQNDDKNDKAIVPLIMIYDDIVINTWESNRQEKLDASSPTGVNCKAHHTYNSDFSISHLSASSSIHSSDIINTGKFLIQFPPEQNISAMQIKCLKTLCIIIITNIFKEDLHPIKRIWIQPNNSTLNS